MNLRLLVVLVSVAFGWSIETARADLVFSSGFRAVSSSATSGVPDFGSTSAAGPYTDSAITISSAPAGTNASATQTSLTPNTTGPLMSGVGHAGSSIPATGTGGYNTAAETIYEVNFQVDANGLYDLDTSVTWTGNVPPFGSGNNQAYVELRNVSNNTQLAYTFRNVSSPGTLSSSTTHALATGVSYRLTAFTRVEGIGTAAGTFSAMGDWSFDLTTAIPEASSVAMMTFATFGAACSAWWRRQLQCRPQLRH